jgi:ABC-type polar amino acid transport system ATPase subunit
VCVLFFNSQVHFNVHCALILQRKSDRVLRRERAAEEISKVQCPRPSNYTDWRNISGHQSPAAIALTVHSRGSVFLFDQLQYYLKLDEAFTYACIQGTIY